MLRFSQINRVLKTSRYLIDNRKPQMVRPNTPPKYSYEIPVLESSMPSLDNAYPDHEHASEYDHIAEHLYSNKRFRFEGQWWEDAFLAKVLWAASPFILLYFVYRNSEKREKRGMPIHNNQVVLDNYNMTGWGADQLNLR